MEFEKQLENILYNENWLNQQLQEDQPILDLFFRKYKVDLKGYAIDFDNFPKVSLVYYFSDNLGGYTMIGIIESLGPNVQG